jgi:hypothetical protein
MRCSKLYVVRNELLAINDTKDDRLSSSSREAFDLEDEGDTSAGEEQIEIHAATLSRYLQRLQYRRYP